VSRYLPAGVTINPGAESVVKNKEKPLIRAVFLSG